ncbi:MAG TPA: hypothetical protein VFA35_02200, partial [Burkholderiaceae bacterium]|nr:hypothetical protein [Burkholderiaceae bacterium]
MKSPKAVIVKSPGFAQENAAPMKSVASVVACLLLAVSASVGAAEAAKPAFKPDLAKGQATSTNVCAACHTADG